MSADRQDEAALARALGEELEAAREWRDAAEKLQRAVVDLRVAEVDRLTPLQQEAGARAGALAQRRMRVQDAVRRRLGLPETAVRVQDLAGRMTDPSVGAAAGELRGIYRRVHRVTAVTGALLGEAVRTSKEVIGALAGTDPRDTGYTKRGARGDAKPLLPLFESMA